MSKEKVVAYLHHVFYKDAEEPAVFGNKQGDLILTSRRLVFITKSFIRGGSFRTIEKMEEALREREGSFAIPLLDLREFGADSSWLGPYIYVKYEADGGAQNLLLLVQQILRHKGVDEEDT